jgi:hypothetical protein
MTVRILDLDGSLTAQRALLRFQPEVVPLADWGPKIRLACSHGRFAQFERALNRQIPAPNDREPVLTLYGSGDFHHVSLALVRRLRQPFNLLVLDKHPDWVQRIPFLHCGTWVAHALQLPGLRRVFHLGGELDFDNLFRWLAPWRLLRSGRIVVFPAVRRFQRGAWRHVEHEPLRAEPERAVTESRVEQLLAPYRDELAGCPLYISLDKDVMTTTDALVNWDSGLLSLTEVQAVLAVARDLAGKRLAGMDVVGDWSPVSLQGWFRQAFHWTEHPTLTMDPGLACQRNEQTNLALLNTHVPACFQGPLPCPANVSGSRQAA